MESKGLLPDVHVLQKKAGIEKSGGVHVFSRHTPATIMTAKGCDIRLLKKSYGIRTFEPLLDMHM